MAKFKCMLSGTIVEFHYEHDILDMRRHPQYEEVENKLPEYEEVEDKLPEPVKVEKVVKPVKE